MLDELQEHLTELGWRSTWLPSQRLKQLRSDWERVFGNAWNEDAQMRVGVKAEYAYEQQQAAVFYLLPLLGLVSGPPEAGIRSPLSGGLECRAGERLPDLSAFFGLEFCVVPLDFEWTMVHTHEDHALGGPYFVKRNWKQP